MSCNRFALKVWLIFFVLTFFVMESNQVSPTPKPCKSSEAEVNVANDAHTEATFMCIPSYTVVLDCEYYDLKGECIQCPAGSSLIGNIGPFNKGCVPISQQILNCEQYRRNEQNQFECVICKTSLNLVVPLTGNPDGILRACAQMYVPGCIEAREFTKTATQTIIGCSVCSQNNDDFSKAGGKFNFQNGMNNGIACPTDGTVSQCSVVRYVPEYNVYACDSVAACPLGKRPVYFIEGPVNIGCLAETNSGYDPNCLAHNKFSQVAAEVQCAMCNPGTELVTSSDGKARCMVPSTKIENCLLYDTYDMTVCKKCADGYPFDYVTKKCKSRRDYNQGCLTMGLVDNKYACLSCPPGFAPKQFYCLKIISNCAVQNQSGLCQQCELGYTLVNNQCISISKMNMKGKSIQETFLDEVQVSSLNLTNPCPQDTDEIRYFYSSQGNCIAIDSQCQVYQEQKGCQKCKLPSQLHIDGLCYRSSSNLSFETDKI